MWVRTNTTAVHKSRTAVLSSSATTGSTEDAINLWLNHNNGWRPNHLDDLVAHFFLNYYVYTLVQY